MRSTRRLAARRRPAPGVAPCFEDANPTRWGGHRFHPARSAFRRPSGVRGVGSPGRLSPHGGPPCACVPLQRSIATRRHRRAGFSSRSSDGASSPGLSRLTTRTGAADPSPAWPPGDAACHVRGLATSIAACTADPAGALRHRSVHRLHPSRRSPRSDGYPSRGPCPPAVPRLGSRRLHEGARRRAASGLRSRTELVRRGSERAACRGLPGLRPSRAFTPGAPAPRGSAESPLSRLDGRASSTVGVPGSPGTSGTVDPSRGYRLSWGLLTLRPSRRHEDRDGGRAHGFASRHESLQSFRAVPCPLVVTRPGLAPRPGVAVHR